jgi:3-hydroxybutyryl-CoA dehydratase
MKSIKIGDFRQYVKTITQSDVETFGRLTGDFNKAHFDPLYCQQTVFKKPIVHGMLLGSLFSTIFGTEFPGEGTIYCSQTLKFLKPVYPDTLLHIKVTVKELIEEKNRVIFITEIFDENQQLMLTGEAMLMPRKDNEDE